MSLLSGYRRVPKSFWDQGRVSCQTSRDGFISAPLCPLRMPPLGFLWALPGLPCEHCANVRVLCLPYVSRRYGELYTLVWTHVSLKGLVHRPIRRFFDQGYHAWSLWTFSMRHPSSRGSHWSLGYRLEVFLVSHSFPWVTGTPSASLHDHHMVFGLGKTPYWRYLSRRKSKMQTLVQEISRDIDMELITPFEPYRRGD